MNLALTAAKNSKYYPQIQFTVRNLIAIITRLLTLGNQGKYISSPKQLVEIRDKKNFPNSYPENKSHLIIVTVLASNSTMACPNTTHSIQLLYINFRESADLSPHNSI